MKAHTGDQYFVSRIVGGSKLQYPREFPWLVSLQYQNGGHFCGGSLIAPNWVLTAAHCTQGSVARVAVGMHKRSECQRNCAMNQYVQIRTVSKIINHERYDDWTMENDISLLKLKANVDYPPISLHNRRSSPSSTLENAGRSLTVAGWGSVYEEGDMSNEPLKVSVSVVSNQKCNLRSSYNGGILPEMMCAGFAQGGTDSCQGDSGGPLFGAQGNVIKQVGVLSWGYDCANAGSPGVYTRVSSYTDWLCDKTGVSSACA